MPDTTVDRFPVFGFRADGTEDDRLILYRRINRGKESPIWQGAISLKGVRRAVRFSTGVDYREKDAKQRAILIANRKFEEVESLLRQKLSVRKIPMKRLIAEWIKSEEERHEVGEITKQWFKTARSVSIHFSKVFGEMTDITQLNEQDVRRYRTHLAKAEIAESSQSQHLQFLRSMFAFAVRKRYLTQSQTPHIPSIKLSRSYRPSFSMEEIHKLHLFFEGWVERASNMPGWVPFYRLQLRDYVMFLAFSGCRLGEVRGMRWEHITLILDGKSYKMWELGVIQEPMPAYEVKVWIPAENSKVRREREVQCSKICFPFLLQRWFSTTIEKQDGNTDYPKPNEPVFILEPKDGVRRPLLYPHKSWDLLMKESGLLLHPTIRKKRTLYSLRHTKIENDILYTDADIYMIARNHGTSVRMIELHYGRSISERQFADKVEYKKKNQDMEKMFEKILESINTKK